MGRSAVLERVGRVLDVRADVDAVTDELRAGLADVRALRSFCDASEAELARRVAEGSSFPERDVADAARGTLNEASRTLDRARTLDCAPSLSAALDSGDISGGHVDALTRASKQLDDAQTVRLFDKVVDLVAVASVATVPDFGKRVRHEVSKLLADDGVARFERQKQATALSTWVDDEGMWRLSGRFDPMTGVRLAARLESTVETLFAESVPETCPTDPVEKQKHLRALALSRLVGGADPLDAEGGLGGAAHLGAKVRPRAARPEFVAVIDASLDESIDVSTTGPPAVTTRPGVKIEQGEYLGRPRVTWPIPIDVPEAVLADLLGDAERADLSVVIVADGLLLRAPGRLDLGRATRLANRAQRRALRGLYSTCAIPGCRVNFDRCKLHHVTWWRHGGRTDIDNLLPVCSHHHHKVHDAGWLVDLGPRRELTLTLPDGNVMTTGPPKRDAA